MDTLLHHVTWFREKGNQFYTFITIDYVAETLGLPPSFDLSQRVSCEHHGVAQKAKWSTTCLADQCRRCIVPAPACVLSSGDASSSSMP